MGDGDLKTDSSGQLVFVGGDLQRLTGIDAIVADALRRLNFFLGEDIFNVTGTGVPWLQEILGKKNPNLGAIRAKLISTIQATPGIQQMTAFTMKFDSTGRNLSGSFRAQTTLGMTDFIPFGQQVPEQVPTP